MHNFKRICSIFKISVATAKDINTQARSKHKMTGGAERVAQGPKRGAGRGSYITNVGEDKTWTRGPWTPALDRVHGQFFLIMRNEQKQK